METTSSAKLLQVSELVQVDDGDGDVIAVPAGQLCWQTQHLDQAVWGHCPIAIVAQGMSQQVSGGVLVL